MLSFLKIYLKNVLAFFYIKLGLVQLAKYHIRSNNLILSIYFHNPTYINFYNCINWLKDNNFNFISVSNLIDIKNGVLNQPTNSVVITVDDGWEANFDNIIPVATSYRVPITIFVTTDPVVKGGGFWWSYVKEMSKYSKNILKVSTLKKIVNSDRFKYVNELKKSIILSRQALTLEKLKTIATNKLITIGSHTITHPILPNCSDLEASIEIIESKNILEYWISKKVIGFSYPNGDYSNREVNLLHKAGYEIGFNTIPSYISKQHLNEIFSLPRFEILDDAGLNENICRMTGVWYRNTLKNKI